MILDPLERVIVSSLGWVDGGALWCLDVASGRIESVRLGDARYLTLCAGRDGYFSVVHHHDGETVRVSAHAFDAPGVELSHCLLTGTERRIEGDLAVWAHLPRYYVAFLVQPELRAYVLVDVDTAKGPAVQPLGWFDSHYDPPYQSPIGATEVPGSHLVAISIQRDSRPVLHDPASGRKVGEIVLAGNHGNPALHFSRDGSALYADDYDTVLRLDPRDWRVLARRRVQGAFTGTAEFIGQFAFDPDERVCAVARPFSGDVVGLDPTTLRIRYRARLGQQPLEVAVLRDRRVYARDWKTGALLTGSLRRAWFV